MGKLRVHELAKKLDMKNAELIEKLKASGMAVKTHSSSVDEAEAMKALGQKPAEEKQPRRRTVVRRRRPDAEVEAEATPEASATAVEEAPAAAEIAAPMAEELEAEGTNIPEVAATTETAVPAVPGTPTVQSPPAAGNLTASVAPSGKAPSNVVRVIDAAQIRERLKAENRNFTPPAKRPRTFTQVREIRVLNDRGGAGPQLVDVTGAPGGARPGKGKQKDAQRQTHRDRRDQRASRDMWFHPGKKRKTGKKGKGPEITQAAQHKRVVEIAEHISVSDLSHQMATKAGQVIAKLMGMGMMVTVNQTIDFDTAEIICSEFGFEVRNVAFEERDLLEEQLEESGGNPEPRAPVVTVMGHVDHGKTSLLDSIRNADVASGESGGITQHIGAYLVDTERGKLTFLDTPGHEAFTAMRARGAEVTDVVVLVVAADDGVMPQTKEAIDHAKAAKVPLVVAINKCDKPDASPERVMQELTEYQLVPEEWGGETMMRKVSAKTGDGIDELLESILLSAEMLDLKAVADKRASGAIVEAQLDKGRGPVATVLVQEGTLQLGDFVVAGEHHGRVRAMYNSRGQKIDIAGPSTPAQVLGLSGVPSAGDNLNVVNDDKTAKRVAEHRAVKTRELELGKTSRVSLENLLQRGADDESHEVRLVLKADVDGSVEALAQSLKNLSTRKVKVAVVGQGVGAITESDVNLALTVGAIVIGFNTKPDSKAQSLAQHEKVDVRNYSVIYEAIDDVRDAMTGKLAPKLEEHHAGTAEVRMVFSVPKLGAIAGTMVTDGKVNKNAKVKVMRGKEMLHEAGIASLRRFKDDVKEVKSGYECGVGVKGFSEFEEGDQLEFYDVIEVKAELDEALVDIEPVAEESPEPPASDGVEAAQA